MKLWGCVIVCVGSGYITQVFGYPGMGKALSELRLRQGDGGDSTEVTGDLATLSDDQLTPVGKQVKSMMVGDGEPESSEKWTSYPKKDTPQCAADTCCIWQYVANDMQKVFRGKSGRCTALARGAVRLGFHDAAGWSKATAPGGGADGSIILAPAEMQRKENKGLEEIVAQMQTWYSQYHPYGVSMADLIQMGATVATVVCPLGPRIRSYVGRRDSTTACPDGLLPPVTGSADFLIEMFENKTIRPHGLTALIGAHTTSQQRFVDPARAGDPQDSTPGVWDVLFYKQTLGNPPKRVLKFQSDVVLSQDPRISEEFQEFAGQGGQKHWNEVCRPHLPCSTTRLTLFHTGLCTGIYSYEPLGCLQHQ